MFNNVVFVLPNLQGGIKAVIWTDVFQALVMYMGIFAILIKVQWSTLKLDLITILGFLLFNMGGGGVNLLITLMLIHTHNSII